MWLHAVSGVVNVKFNFTTHYFSFLGKFLTMLRSASQLATAAA